MDFYGFPLQGRPITIRDRQSGGVGSKSEYIANTSEYKRINLRITWSLELMGFGALQL
jgi:hypothetical protein